MPVILLKILLLFCISRIYLPLHFLVKYKIGAVKTQNKYDEEGIDLHYHFSSKSAL